MLMGGCFIYFAAVQSDLVFISGILVLLSLVIMVIVFAQTSSLKKNNYKKLRKDPFT